MSTSPRRAALSAVAAATALVTAVVPLAACGAGNNAVTARYYSPSDGVNFVFRHIKISNALVIAPPDGSTDGLLSVHVANDGLEPDRITSIETQPGGPVQLQGPSEIPAKGALSFGGPTATTRGVLPGFTARAGEAITLRITTERVGAIPPITTVIVPPTGFYEGFVVTPTGPPPTVSVPPGGNVTPSAPAGTGGGGGPSGGEPKQS